MPALSFAGFVTSLRCAARWRFVGLGVVTVAVAACLALALAAFSTPALAATDPDTADRTLSEVRQQLAVIQKGLGDDDSDERLVAARDAALELQRRVSELAVALTPALANMQARAAELGTPPASGEAPDIAAQRAALDKQVNQLDAQVKLARLLEVESTQAVERILAHRRSSFQARLFERTASVLAPPFWEELYANLPRDLGRVGQLLMQLRDSARATPLGVWAALVLAAVAIVAAFVWTRDALLRFSATRVPAGRLRRSALATAMTFLPTLVCLAAVGLVALGPGWALSLSEAQTRLLGAVVAATSFGTYIASLGYALLSPRRPSWRLPPLPQLLAARLRRFPLLLGAAIGGWYIVERLATLVNATLATTVALNALIAIVLALLLVRGLRRGRDAIREVRESGDASGSETTGQSGPKTSTTQQPWWAALIGGAAWVLVGLSLACVLSGFVALGSFIVKQISWIAIVACTFYLLSALIDDAAMALLAGGAGGSGNSGNSGSGASGGSTAGAVNDGRRDGASLPHGRLGAQVAVLISGACRIFIALLALVLILAPFGEGPTELMTRAGSAGEGVAVGEIQVRPGLVLQAALVLVIGLLVVRLGQRWLAERYLPTTDIDPGMGSSITRLLGYLGMVVAVAMALSAVGLGLERVAWVASALSVGIGFGLQAVVSNFVAGLILLAERPVKVGDWVSLSGVEGDIRRINVRATEIQTGDRSTVIVPNSEFITKIVRNLTLANPLGVVSIKLPMPLNTDIERVRDILLTCLTEHQDVLATPAPSVNLEGIEAANLVISLSGSVSSPRRVYAVRSSLLFDILRRLREANIPLGKPVVSATAAEEDG